jgi:hypothetical protein
LVQQIYKCVAKFRNVGTVGQKAGSGAPKKRIPEIVADVSARMKQSPNKNMQGRVNSYIEAWREHFEHFL